MIVGRQLTRESVESGMLEYKIMLLNEFMDVLFPKSIIKPLLANILMFWVNFGLIIHCSCMQSSEG